MAKYLLPCKCGQRIPVEISQAGGTVACACGATLEIPALRGLRQLEPYQAAENAKRQRREWSQARGTTFVIALVILLAGLTISALALWNLLQVPFISVAEEQQHFADIVEDLSVSQLYEEWKLIRDEGIGRRGANPYVQIRQFRNWSTRVLAVGLTLAVVGLLGVVGPMLVRSKAAP